MKILFMKQDALSFIKENMKTLYVNYYREKTNKWIYDLFDYDPFDVVIEVPDFELAPIIANRKGFTELENCKIIYEKLKCISESQASDERLWAGLCNGTFYEYVRNRWGYDMLDFKETKSDADSVLSRFFFKNGKYRNSLSKCWWVGHNTYLQNDNNHYQLLDYLEADDFSTKINDLFYNYAFSSNLQIVTGIIKGWHTATNDRKLTIREYFRPMMQDFNALGGGVLLDIYSEEEIEKIVYDYIVSLIIKESPIVSDNNDDDIDE